MNRRRTALVLLIVLLSLIACGSSSPAVINRDAPVTTQRPGNPDVKVWVNTNSGVYHCPGTRWYGKTKSGQFMTQREAQAKGYRPAYGAGGGEHKKSSKKTTSTSVMANMLCGPLVNVVAVLQPSAHLPPPQVVQRFY